MKYTNGKWTNGTRQEGSEMNDVIRYEPGTNAAKIEKYVRGKNTFYNRWRKMFTPTRLDDLCAECLMRFGTLPGWFEYPYARARRQWNVARELENRQREWRNLIRGWCFATGVTKYKIQGVQFYKYYAAWYRVKWENEHGKIDCPVARQMY